MLQWLDEENVPFTTDAMDFAASRGDLEIVKWLYQYRIEGGTAKAMYDAAQEGYLEILKFLYEN